MDVLTWAKWSFLVAALGCVVAGAAVTMLVVGGDAMGHWIIVLSLLCVAGWAISLAATGRLARAQRIG